MMISLGKEVKGYVPRNSFGIFAIVFMIATTLIHSQPIFDSNKTDSTKISYYHLGEFAKYVTYKPLADTAISNLKAEVRSLELLVDIKDQKILSSEKIISSLEQQNTSKDERIRNNNEIFRVKEEKYELLLTQQKKKKWSWAAVGALLGATIGAIISK